MSTESESLIPGETEQDATHDFWRAALEKVEQKSKIVWEPQKGPQTELIKHLDTFEVFYGGARGSGKGLLLDEPVMTPSGYVEIGSLRVGDEICSIGGGTQYVTGVFRNYDQQCYRVTFDDGISVVCDAPHKWHVRFPGTSLKRVPSMEFKGRTIYGRRVSTEDLYERFVSRRGRLHACYPVVPAISPISVESVEPIIDPYVLGSLIGDGHFRASGSHEEVSFGTNDRQSEEYMSLHGFSVKARSGDFVWMRSVGESRNFYVDELSRLGIYGLHGDDKYVPDECFRWGRWDREALLQGLLDTDGSVTSGQAKFDSKSPELVWCVIELANSLGGHGSLKRYKNGMFRAILRLPHWVTPFRLNRKAKKYKGQRRSGDAFGRRIVSIEKLQDPMDTVCISVSDESMLFVGKNGIPLSNTDAMLGDWIYHERKYGKAARGIFFRREAVNLEDVLNRSKEIYPELGAVWNAGSRTWKFPSGATLSFRHLWDDDAARRYQGFNLTRVYCEELTHWPSDQPIMKVMATLRSAKGVKVGFRATGNPGGIGHCVRRGDVLTPAGWVDIRSMSVGDPVFTVNQSGEMVESVVSQFHEYDFSGQLIRYDARGFTMEATPEHRVAKVGGTKSDPGSKFSLVPVSELPGQATILRSVTWNSDDIESFSVPEIPSRKRKAAQPVTISGDHFCSLMGWFLSEGNVVHRDRAFCISQMKADHRETIRSLLMDIGFEFSESKTGFTVYAMDWYEYLRRYGKSRDKFTPDCILRASPRQLKLFLDAAMSGDGHWRSSSGGTYYTISRRLADDFAHIALKCGYIVYQSSRHRENRDGLSYEVSIKKKKSGGTEILTGNHLYNVNTKTVRSTKKTMVNYTGKVYCVGIEGTHSFIIRQNGSAWVSGNSWCKSRYIDPAPKGNMPIVDPDTNQIRIFIPGRLEDNKILTQSDPAYEARLMQSGPPHLVKAWRWGEWNIVAGGYFDDVFDYDTHIYPRFDIPRGWTLRRGFDWGSAKPSAFGIFAISDGTTADRNPVFMPRGSMVLIHEWYTCQMKHGSMVPNRGLRLSNQQLGMEIGIRSEQVSMECAETNRDLTRNMLPYGGCVADPSIFTTQGGPSIYDQMRSAAVMSHHRLFFSRADNSRVAGWQRIRNMLQAARDFDLEHPWLCAFDTCTNFIRTIPTLPRDGRNSDDIDTNSEDHIADMVRYVAMSGSGGIQTTTFDI